MITAGRIKTQDSQTEVIPANAPLASLLGVSNSLVPCRVNHFPEGKMVSREAWLIFFRKGTHLLQLFVRCKLDRAVRHDPQAVYGISSHVAFETLFPPYSNKTSPNTLVLVGALRLNLSKKMSAYVMHGSVIKTHCIIFSLSRGLTTVLDAAPATPPAIKYEEISGLKKTKTLRFTSSSCSASCSASACDVVGCDDGIMLFALSKQAYKRITAKYYAGDQRKHW
jgi:hypothetical protein